MIASSSRSFRLIRFVALVTLVLAAAAVLTACGGGGASKSEIAAAEKRGRQLKAERDKEKKLEGEIHKLKKEREEETEAGGSSGPPAQEVPPAPESERTSCGGSLSVGPDTTCAFAEEVRNEYEYEFGSGSGTVYAYSSANNETYEMFCTAAPHECTGAIDASVFFP